MSPNKENGQSDQSPQETRRKALNRVVPLAVGAIMKSQSAFSPLSIAGRAADQYDEMLRRHIAPVNAFLKKKLPKLEFLNLTDEGTGKFSFTATRESVLSSVVSQYLRVNHREDYAFISPFHVFPASQEALDAKSCYCELSLSRGSVFGRLIGEKPKPNLIWSLQSNTIRSESPSEIWLFVTSGLNKSEEADFLMDPVFASEKGFLPGRIMVVGLNTVFAEVIRDERYTIENAESEMRAGGQLSNLKITLIENAKNQEKKGIEL